MAQASKQSASIGDVATLYVRNIPAELYATLQRWAADAGRSVNAEMIDLLEREAARRQRYDEWWDKVVELRRLGPIVREGPDVVDMIREDRDRGHRPDQGF